MNTTAIFLTNNELPEKWQTFHRKCFLEAFDGPIISVSRKKMDLGRNLIQTEPKSAANVYVQLLRAAKLVETKYLAVVEDDSLYPAEHFEYEPTTVSYNMAHWSLFSWEPDLFSWRNRFGNYSMIAPTQTVIDALEEREQKYPEGIPPREAGEIGRWRIENRLGVTRNKVTEFYSTVPIINLNHDYALDERQKAHWKRHGQLRCTELPHWGKPQDIIKYYK